METVEPELQPEAAAADSQDEVVKVLSSRTNRSILSLLAVEPTYPRKIGNLLSLSEAEAARRLKHMEGLGLVQGAWSYVGKNIKLYKLAVEGIAFRFGTTGLTLELLRPGGKPSKSFTVLPFLMNVPVPQVFLGREEELRILRGDDRVVIVEGMAGIGKTTLVARYANVDRGERALFWHTFRGLESLNWILNRFGVFLAQHGDPALLQAIEQSVATSDQRELLLRTLDHEHFLVVLDDVHRIEDPALRELLTDAVNRIVRAKLIITGREAPRSNVAVPNRRIIHLAGLKDSEVAQFLSERKIELPPDLLPKVREEVGGHPMALNLLLEASQELGVPVHKLLDKIPERNVEDYLLQEVYGTLSDDEKQTLSLASLFRSGFDIDDLNALAKRNYEHLLLKLRRRLLVQIQGDQYSLHEVIRNFFYKLLKDRDALHVKAAQYFEGLRTLEGRLEALHHFLTANRKDQVLRLLADNLDLKQFDFIDAGYQNLYYSVLNAFDKKEVTDAGRWALIQDEKGDILYMRGQPHQALVLYEDSAKHFDKGRDAERVLDLAWKRALCHQQLGHLREAEELVAHGLKRAEGHAGQAVDRLTALKAELAKSEKAEKSAAKPARPAPRPARRTA